jgi:hypothetical protein
MSKSDIDTLTEMLPDDPETCERLTIESMELVSDGGFAITVGNMDGDRRWKHTIITEEV